MASNGNAAVATHYNARPNQDRRERAASRIRQLRGFNNWVKSLLIQQYAGAAVDSGRGRLCVLDMCGGKGGDLGKWARLPQLTDYVLLDVAGSSVAHARERYREGARRYHFKAQFLTGDAFSEKALSDAHRGAFDVVSCQFALHYAFDTPARADTAIANVAKALRANGLFIGTIPDWRILSQKRSAQGQRFGNALYSITFDQDNARRYTFSLTDAIDGLAEYAVPVQTLIALCRRHGLELVLFQNFHQLYARHGQDGTQRTLMQKMGCFDARGHLPEAQWHIAGLYAAFVFRKRPPTSSPTATHSSV